ncbi:MAG: DUF1549 domain-containing protein, partial [Verrucomicrobia bacterium]|nr:DUF1549 domain-containing protein [Verrucomicrobiota bacterium]
ISGLVPAMPDGGDPLSENEVDLVFDWINTGAPWPEERVLKDDPPRDLNWWSLKPIQKTSVPGKRTDHPLDAFIDQQLLEKKLTPVGEADPRALIRRLSYDLTGLPPVPEEVERFVVDYESSKSVKTHDEIWQSLIDLYLDSPEFGEKWAQHWLDLARFAETHGYDKDKLRLNAWPYRDYVIRSFNEDKPYGRFVQEQVAGDVLFPGDSDGIIGLGFLAAGPWDHVGHYEVGEDKLDGRIAKHHDRDEMVSAVFNVFQSTTVQCAQCHHHKFDPIKMEDYYRLHAVFAAVDRSDRIFEGLTPEQTIERNQLLTQINRLKREHYYINDDVERELTARVSGIKRRIREIKETYGTGNNPRLGYRSGVKSNADSDTWVQVDLGKGTSVTQIFLIPAFDGKSEKGYGFPLQYRVEASDDPAFEENVRLLMDASQEDQPNPGTETIAVDVGPPAIRYIRVAVTRLKEESAGHLFALGELQAVDSFAEKNFAFNTMVTSSDSFEEGEHWNPENLVDDVFFRGDFDPSVFEELRALEVERDRITAEIRSPQIEARRKEVTAELKVLEEQLKAYQSKSLVYAANTNWASVGRFFATDGKPRPIHLLNRGDLESPGEAMTPGALPLWDGAPESFFESAEWKEGEARAELARYLTRKDNPLLWRTMANRLVQWTLGKPLAGSPNDFGRAGREPTHPELLDYLATRLRDDPQQSIKSMIRLLVSSKAYRRSSEHVPENAAIDSDNQFWWRADRRRLTAEEFRDSLLAVSGALNLKDRGGPSFYDFVIEKPQHSPHYEYHLHDPNDPKSHRRTVYRFVVRSQPQPMLTTLDCADPSISVAVRDESTSALQALTQWNHTLVEAMAKRFGERLLEAPEKSTEALVNRATALALGRPPNQNESKLLGEHYETHGAASLARVLFNLNDFTYLD